MKYRVTSPRDAALLLGDAQNGFRNGSVIEPFRTSLPLAEFQQAGVLHARRIMARRGGVLIADSVGLGKTFTALALIEERIASGRAAKLIVPTSLKRMWRKELQRLEPEQPVAILSHTQLARGSAGAYAQEVQGEPGARDPSRSRDLIVVDEAHAFRNPRTQRYRALRRLCRGTDVVLLTATPVNNSLSDLYFQLRLFCADSAFRDLGIGSLRLAFEDDAGIDAVLGSIMIRRTRHQVRAIHAGSGTGGGTATSLSFPSWVELHVAPYDLPLPAAEIHDTLLRLRFPAFAALSARGTADLVRFSLLKRFESSLFAAAASVGRQLRFHEEMAAALEHGRELSPAAFRALYETVDDALQLVLHEVALDSRAASPDLMHAVLQEIETLRHLRHRLAGSADRKLDVLIEILKARQHKRARTIVFSEYRDTARYLWKQLRRRFPVALIDGAAAWIGETSSSRRVVVERFAPIVNCARAVHEREAVSVLIATDVLAEGMNLQDADAVISYDLPWNPVRLIQRAGRIDRMGSPHARVEVHNFMPDREFDEFLGVARTLRRKLETVRSTVGLERPILENQDTLDVMHALRFGDAGILGRIEDGFLLPSASFSTTSSMATVPAVSAMPASTGHRALIGFARRSDCAVLVAELDGGPRFSTDDTHAAIQAALCCNVVSPVDGARWLQCAMQLIDSGTLGDALLARTRADPRSPPNLLARRIRRLLGELPFGSDAATAYERADRVVERLAGRLTADLEVELAALSLSRAASLQELLDTIERAFVEYGASAAEERWRICALIVLE